MINNVESTVPAQVKNLLYSEIPFGAQYVIYTKSNGTYTNTVYEALYMPLGSDTVNVITVSRDGSRYVVSRSEGGNTIESVQYPYYAYSNIPEYGIRETLPVTADITATMLLVLTAVVVVKWLFGIVFNRRI